MANENRSWRDTDSTKIQMKFKITNSEYLESFPNSKNWWIEASNFSFVYAIEETIVGPTFVVAAFLPGGFFFAKGCDFTSFETSSRLKGSSPASYTFRKYWVISYGYPMHKQSTHWTLYGHIICKLNKTI